MKELLVIGIVLWAGPVMACFQIWTGFVTLRSDVLSGRVTFEQKALRSTLELHKFAAAADDKNLNSRSIKELRINPHVEATTKTDSAGKFSFGAVAPGKYVIEMTSPSHEAIAVEMMQPDSLTAPSRLWINGYADWCKTVFVEPSNLGILAMSGSKK
jgi:hypothetical protein